LLIVDEVKYGPWPNAFMGYSSPGRWLGIARLSLFMLKTIEVPPGACWLGISTGWILVLLVIFHERIWK